VIQTIMKIVVVSVYTKISEPRRPVAAARAPRGPAAAACATIKR
jgi:hypothetical protein